MPPGNKYARDKLSKEVLAYYSDPSVPIGSIKTIWNEEGKRSGVKQRFHDLRHTAVARIVKARVPLTIIGRIVGWAPSTIGAMANIYGHSTLDDLRSAVEALSESLAFPQVSTSDDLSRIFSLFNCWWTR